MAKEFTVTKLESAKRQLETAIELWFQDADPVSIHTLISAACNILNDVGRKKANKPLKTYDGASLGIKKEFHAEWFKAARNAQNFFKHADGDPDATLEFNPDANMFVTWDAIEHFEILGQKRSALMTVFWDYFRIHFAEYLNPHLVDDIRSSGMAKLSKMQFLQEDLARLKGKDGMA